MTRRGARQGVLRGRSGGCRGLFCRPHALGGRVGGILGLPERRLSGEEVREDPRARLVGQAHVGIRVAHARGQRGVERGLLGRWLIWFPLGDIRRPMGHLRPIGRGPVGQAPPVAKDKVPLVRLAHHHSPPPSPSNASFSSPRASRRRLRTVDGRSPSMRAISSVL